MLQTSSAEVASKFAYYNDCLWPRVTRLFGDFISDQTTSGNFQLRPTNRIHKSKVARRETPEVTKSFLGPQL